MKVYLIDHEDSFTLNLRDWLWEGFDVLKIHPKIKIYHEHDLRKLQNQKGLFVYSPGGGHPKERRKSIHFFKHFIFKKNPFLGVCLGHQIMGLALGGEIIKCQKIIHGVKRKMEVINNSKIFGEKGNLLDVAVYNSLVIKFKKLNPNLKISVLRKDTQEIYGIEYEEKNFPLAVGMQFHPESFLSNNLLIKAIRTLFLMSST